MPSDVSTCGAGPVRVSADGDGGPRRRRQPRRRRLSRPTTSCIPACARPAAARSPPTPAAASSLCAPLLLPAAPPAPPPPPARARPRRRAPSATARLSPSPCRAWRRLVRRVVQVRTILAHRLALVPELPLTLRDVEQERRILDVAIGLAERVERLLELAEVVVLAAGAKRAARARALLSAAEAWALMTMTASAKDRNEQSCAQRRPLTNCGLNVIGGSLEKLLRGGKKRRKRDVDYTRRRRNASAIQTRRTPSCGDAAAAHRAAAVAAAAMVAVAARAADAGAGAVSAAAARFAAAACLSRRPRAAPGPATSPCPAARSRSRPPSPSGFPPSSPPP